MKPKTKKILDEMQKLFNKKVDAWEFSCYFPEMVFNGYEEIEQEYKDLAYYLDQNIPYICDEGEPGFDPTHMIEELKKVYEHALTIIQQS